MRAKITNHISETTDENGPKMVLKWFQNRSWRGSGGHLGATLETRCFQNLIFDDFGSMLGPPLGPVWVHFGHHVFFIFFWGGFLMALTSIWAPKTFPKWDPTVGQNPNLKIIDFDCIYYTLATFKGAENHNCLMLFGTRFWEGFGNPFCTFWITFGIPLDTIFVIVGVPFLHRFADTLQTSKN